MANRTKVLIIVVLLVLTLVNVCCSDKTIEVKTKYGAILGKIENTIFKNKDYFAFRGIPYALPPVEKLRFQPPVPHKGWNDTLEALEQTPTCMQFSARMRNNEPFGISGSEDCLYVNIYTPNLKDNAPVIVFDYNDNFKTGFNGTKTYSPDNFLEEDVIIVTISHRLGLFGYLTTEDEVIPANNGLRDFILGLKWIKENIQNFGGNPEKVTLMGSCGGASLVNAMLYSEKAKGLFSGAIIQSGTTFEMQYFSENSKEIVFNFGSKLGINTTDSEELLKQLQKVDSTKLLTDVVTILADDVNKSKDKQLTTQAFTPIVEKTSDAVLTYLPEEGKIVNDIPVIIGFNSREGLDYVSHFLINPKLFSPDVGHNLLSFPLRTGFYFDSKAYDKANKEIKDFYFGTKDLDYTAILDYAVYAGDVMNGYAVQKATESLATQMKSPVYYYMFDFKGQLNENTQYLNRYGLLSVDHWGATVGDELCYLHVCSRIKTYYLQFKDMLSEQREQKVMKKMVRMWTNFAKFGNPTPPKDDVLKGFTWEPVKNITELSYLHVTKKLQMSTNPLGERGKFWDYFLKKYADKAVDGIVKEEEIREEL